MSAEEREIIADLMRIIDGTQQMPWWNIEGGTDNPAFKRARILLRTPSEKEPS